MSLHHKPVVLIPARMESSRFPGKPLAKILGVPMIERVYRQVIRSDGISNCYVCTDSRLILEYCHSKDIPVVETGACETGTDRVLCAAEVINATKIINVQGDEPLIDPEFITELAAFLDEGVSRNLDNSRVIYTAVSPAQDQDLSDDSVVKTVASSDDRAVYFSRNKVASVSTDGSPCFLKHIGAYGYHIEALRIFGGLGLSGLESLEKIELMRWLEAGNSIHLIHSDHSPVSVDTPNDLQAVESAILSAVAADF